MHLQVMVDLTIPHRLAQVIYAVIIDLLIHRIYGVHWLAFSVDWMQDGVKYIADGLTHKTQLALALIPT